jgi:mRNA-degrading endonuclease RelE of RelBE toxin-antitoxin system
MADKITKFINKLTTNQRELVLSLVLRLSVEDYYGLDIKSIKGQKNIYRLRHGRIRIVYYRIGNEFDILSVGNRDDRTYSGF